MNELAEVWRYRELLLNFVRRDLKIRYKNSVLGFAWSLLNPLFQILVLVIAFRYMMPVGGRNYSAKLFLAMVPWMFFAQALMDGTSCVAEQVQLIKKVYFPRLLLPLSTLCSNLVHFVLGLAVLAGFFALRHVTLEWSHVPLALGGLAIQIAFLAGLMLAASSLAVYYNDVKFMLMSLVQAWFFLSPVMLPPEMALHGLQQQMPFPQVAKAIYLLNPMAPPLIAYRTLLPHDAVGATTNDYLQVITQLVPDFMSYYAASALVAAAMLLVGFLIFRRLQWHFAELG